MKHPHNFDPFAPVYGDEPSAKGGVIARRIEPPSLGAVHLGMIRIDEICMEAPDPVNVMRQKLADLGGVPVGNVQFQGSHQEGNMIIGDFVVSKRTT